MTENTRIKSPYFKNALEMDDFEDRVHALKNSPQAIVIAFDRDIKDGNTAFDIASKQKLSQKDLLDALLYVVSRISESHGLITTIKVSPMPEATPEILELVKKMFGGSPINIKRPPEEGAITP